MGYGIGALIKLINKKKLDRFYIDIYLKAIIDVKKD
jgi:hypothetical protein